ncbi:DUF1854 domain-containing protein [Paenibacillus thiaminolyticus]|uniref:DUF1854 domain-containing protein n=1 Tax=Paenibacillus thiaminolyticus TaxID=49283 RepID=UPI0035A69D48
MDCWLERSAGRSAGIDTRQHQSIGTKARRGCNSEGGRIVQVRQHHDLWIWQPEPDAGLVRMTMRNLHEHVQLHGANRLLLTDVNGRRAEIRDLQALNGASKKWLKDVL